LIRLSFFSLRRMTILLEIREIIVLLYRPHISKSINKRKLSFVGKLSGFLASVRKM